MQKINNKLIFIIIIICGIAYGIVSRFIKNRNIENIENISEEIEINNQFENDTILNDNVKKLVIHITGSVCNEGIYELEENSRIADAVKMAGGLKEDADLKQINLAYLLEDGMKINIPSKNDKIQENIISEENYVTKDNSNLSKNQKDTKVNINTATQTELETLPGIGPSIALKIVNYRKEKGKFIKIEDIKNVSGIGDSKFNKIKDFIKT